ncbi:hypothetical protein ACU4GG_40545 [Streptomyces nojiriensis]
MTAPFFRFRTGKPSSASTARPSPEDPVPAPAAENTRVPEPAEPLCRITRST